MGNRPRTPVLRTAAAPSQGRAEGSGFSVARRAPGPGGPSEAGGVELGGVEPGGVEPGGGRPWPWWPASPLAGWDTPNLRTGSSVRTGSAEARAASAQGPLPSRSGVRSPFPWMSRWLFFENNLEKNFPKLCSALAGVCAREAAGRLTRGRRQGARLDFGTFRTCRCGLPSPCTCREGRWTRA